MAKEPKIVPFGKYELLEKIAVGGMAEIFKARTKGVGGFEKYLAIKRILPHLSENKDFIDMLINEAKIAVMLSHANIVQIYDLGKIDDSYFIAMEFIEGKDLRALMTRCDQIGMPLFIQHAIFVAIEVCKGLEYAHAKNDNNQRELNIVHRDISPQNIMISYEGEVKLTDFGIAKANVNISETEAGVVKGKYEYMSPEQASGLAVDRRTDIFATGIVLYEMLTGQKPFKGESDLTILERVREAKVDPPSKYNKSIPKKLEKIVLKALAREAADRYQTSTELKDDLTKFFYSSTFNFTTSNLAAFMKSIFAEEIKLDVLTDGDGNTGIGKRPDLSTNTDGNTVSRIFGNPGSEKFRKSSPSAVGSISADSAVALNVDPPSSSRSIGGEALASIEEEINRILIPGKTNVGKAPTRSAPSNATSTAAAAALAPSAVPAENAAKATVATPRPASPSSGGSAMDMVQSAAMELAMEIEMAMPPAIGPSRIGPPDAPAREKSARPTPTPSDEAEAPTEDGNGISWDGADEKLDDRIADRLDSTSSRGGNSRPTRPLEEEESATEPDDPPVAERSTEEARSPRIQVELKDSTASAPNPGGREPTFINTKSGATNGDARPIGSSTGSRPPTSPSVAAKKAPMRVAKERIRGVTVNAPNPDPGESSATREPPRESPAQEPSARGRGQETDSEGTANSDRLNASDSGQKGESTVIGRKPEFTGSGRRIDNSGSSSRPLARETTDGRPAADSTDAGDQPQASVSRTMNSPAESRGRGNDRDRSEREISRPHPAASRRAAQLETDGSAFDSEDDFAVPTERPARNNNRRPAPVDEQADLYPAAAKRVILHPAVLILICAILFFAGVVIAKLM